ncbi:CCR4-NOT transcription complex subunit 10-like [Mytilus californianus]|uniref:CCR4-NOT transcription complex subunit 10-like n=1 Tax=Mytilus californianus TaxID=6549 RepID=UPI0022465EE0|nr:CCR4-NOT transcription complex subunit 10-like [Mytilus californianus]XP_052063395.1 CCR4-NOT transcription complex subunit 10-like [Mytilus californianus]
MASQENKDDCPQETVDIPPPIPSVTEPQKQIASQALQEFEKKNYGACCNLTHKLFVERSMDPKVVHNKAVAEFYQSGFLTTDEFRQSLDKVCQMANISMDNSDSLEDVDHSVLYFNQAVIFYHLRQYKAATKVLDKLFQFIEPIEENLAKKAIMLLVELYLCTFQPEKAMGMLSYAEKNVFNTGKSGGEKEGKDKEDNMADDPLKTKLSLYKTRCLLMMKSMKSSKREIKALITAHPMNLSVLYLKSNFEYMRSNHRKAMKMMGIAPSSSTLFTEAGECLPVMYHNNMGCIHFYLRKHHLGAFYFRKAIQENENALRDITRGAEHNKNLSGKPLHSIGMSRHYELLYNMGIQMLHCGKPVAAFDCLVEAVQVFRTNPRLWLRLAECCIMTNRENNDDDRKLEKRLEVIQGSDGSGIHRKLRLGPGLRTDRVSPGTPAIPASTYEFAALCLRNALMLLPEETQKSDIPNTDDQDGIKPNPESLLVPAPPGNPMKSIEVANLRCSVLAAAAYVGICLNDFTMALQHAENLLKQPRLSGAQRYLGHLYMAEALVALDKIADGIQHLNPELVTDINTLPPEPKSDQDKNEKNEKTEKDKGDKDQETEVKGSFYPWSPRDLTRAKAIMQYNLATAHAIRGEYDKAMANLVESSNYMGTPLPAQMYFLKLYLDLIEGRRKLAQIVIKDHFGHVTPNRENKMTYKSGTPRPDTSVP